MLCGRTACKLVARPENTGVVDVSRVSQKAEDAEDVPQTVFFAVTNSSECALCGRGAIEGSSKPANAGFSGVLEASQKSEDVSQKEEFAVPSSAEDAFCGRTECESLSSPKTAGVEGISEVSQKAGLASQTAFFVVLSSGDCATHGSEDGEAARFVSSVLGASSGTRSTFVNTVFPVLGSMRITTFGRSGVPCAAQRASIFSQEKPGRDTGEGVVGWGFLDGIAVSKKQCRESTPSRSLIFSEVGKSLIRRKPRSLVETTHFQNGNFLLTRFQSSLGVLQFNFLGLPVEGLNNIAAPFLMPDFGTGFAVNVTVIAAPTIRLFAVRNFVPNALMVRNKALLKIDFMRLYGLSVTVAGLQESLGRVGVGTDADRPLFWRH